MFLEHLVLGSFADLLALVSQTSLRFQLSFFRSLFVLSLRMQNRLITDSFVERFKNDATGIRLGLKPGARRRLFRVGSLNVAGFLKPLFEVPFIRKSDVSVLP